MEPPAAHPARDSPAFPGRPGRGIPTKPPPRRRRATRPGAGTDALRAAMLLALAVVAGGAGARADEAPTPYPDSLVFAPPEREVPVSSRVARAADTEEGVPLAPFGEHLLTDVEAWRARGEERGRAYMVGDYNRVDRLRLGWGYEFQRPDKLIPRMGARLEYAFQRERVMYGAQIEQPIGDPGRLALGVSMVRRTDHNDLQQVSDEENSLAFLFARQDYRDYFEREGFGGYAALRVPAWTTLSVHLRNDEYRALALDAGTRSFVHMGRDLRPNPAIDPGQAHTLSLRLDHRVHIRQRLRAGFYRWIDVERAGHGLGGAFQYTRVLADLRSVLRLSPATTLAVRAVAGHAVEGRLPAQRVFPAGGVDGLRAHRLAEYRGNQLALAQTEYTVGLWKLRSQFFEGGLHAIAFVDAGRAWQNDEHHWDLDRQRVQTDGGLGLGTSEDNLRIYFAKNLRRPGSDFVVSVRLQRPF